jgi:hypothetical protein
MHLEQVVKAEIANRLTTSEGLRQLLGETVGALTADFDALGKKFEVNFRGAGGGGCSGAVSAGQCLPVQAP